MQDRLDNLRQFFPAEVTGAYLAIQGIMTANDVGPSENDSLMLCLALVLTGINAWIYYSFKNLRFDSLKGISWQVIIAIGFMLWVFNIDMPRFVDTRFIGPRIELVAPIGLVLYTLITSFVGFSQETQDANG